MNYIHINNTNVLKDLFKRCDIIFERKEQKENFHAYCTGLLLEIKRKNIKSIAEHIIGSDYQSLHNFISESNWDEEKLNILRIQNLQQDKQMKTHANGYLIIDDDGKKKRGNKTFGVKRQWCGNLGKVENCQVAVTSYWTDKDKGYPISSKIYLPKDLVAEENEKNDSEAKSFKSKPVIGLDLIDKSKQLGVKFKKLLFDAWYGSNPNFVKKVEAKKEKYITKLYMNRRVALERGVPYIKLEELVTLLKSDLFKKTTYITCSGEIREVFTLDIPLFIKNLGRRRVIVVKPSSDCTDLTEIDCYMTNDEKSSTEEILHEWTFRHKIEEFYQFAKDNLGLDQFQTRSERANMRHFYMVFLIYSFLMELRIKEMIILGGIEFFTEPCQKISQVQKCIVTILFFRFLHWCKFHRKQLYAHIENINKIKVKSVLAFCNNLTK